MAAYACGVLANTIEARAKTQGQSPNLERSRPIVRRQLICRNQDHSLHQPLSRSDRPTFTRRDGFIGCGQKRIAPCSRDGDCLRTAISAPKRGEDRDNRRLGQFTA